MSTWPSIFIATQKQGGLVKVWLDMWRKQLILEAIDPIVFDFQEVGNLVQSLEAISREGIQSKEAMDPLGVPQKPIMINHKTRAYACRGGLMIAKNSTVISFPLIVADEVIGGIKEIASKI